MGFDEDLDDMAKQYELSIEELRNMKLNDLKKFAKDELGLELHVKLYEGEIISKEQVDKDFRRREKLDGSSYTLSEKFMWYMEDHHPRVYGFLKT